DEDLLGHVTSANIACGFHAGDPRVMDATVAMAAERGVVIGAHVSYNDLVGDEKMAAALGEAVTSYGGLAVLMLGGSPAAEVLRDQGVQVVREGFADRGYTAAGRLVPRSQPGAV